MAVEHIDGDRSDAVGPPRSDGGTDGLRGHLVLLGLLTGGYLIALVGGVISPWVVPQVLGRYLDSTQQASSLFAPGGVAVRSAFRVAFASFPIVFAACVVAIDMVAIRSLTDRSTPNRRGLAAWGLLAVAGLTVLVAPVNPILPPYGLIQLLSAPVFAVVTGTVLVAMAGGVAGVAGLSIPVSLTRGGVSLATATRRAVADVRSAPITEISRIQPVVLGWGLGSSLLFVGSGLLGLALGIFVVGILLVPVVLVVWVLAALAFAGGHLRYRLHTVSNSSHA